MSIELAKKIVAVSFEWELQLDNPKSDGASQKLLDVK